MDIYNSDTHLWTTSKLSEARGQLLGVVSGNKLALAGQWRSNHSIKKKKPGSQTTRLF
jgi:hypothetical protein